MATTVPSLNFYVAATISWYKSRHISGHREDNCSPESHITRECIKVNICDSYHLDERGDEEEEGAAIPRIKNVSMNIEPPNFYVTSAYGWYKYTTNKVTVPKQIVRALGSSLHAYVVNMSNICLYNKKVKLDS